MISLGRETLCGLFESEGNTRVLITQRRSGAQKVGKRKIVEYQIAEKDGWDERKEKREKRRRKA